MVRKSAKSKAPLKSIDYELLKTGDASHEIIDNLKSQLWTGFNRQSTKDETSALVCLIAYAKSIDNWSFLLEDDVKFKILYSRILIDIDQDMKSADRLLCILSLIKNINNDVIRSTIKGLFSISIWSNLKHIDELLKSRSETQSDSLTERYYLSLEQDKLFEDQKVMDIQRRFLYKILLNLSQSNLSEPCFTLYVKILIQMVSFLPTRRYTNFMLQQLNVGALISTKNISPDLTQYLLYLINYPIDDFTGSLLTGEAASNKYAEKFKLFETKLFNICGITDIKYDISKEKFIEMLSSQEVEKLMELCDSLLIDCTLFETGSDIVEVLYDYIQDFHFLFTISDDTLKITHQASSIFTDPDMYYTDYLSLEDFKWKQYKYSRTLLQNLVSEFVMNVAERLSIKEVNGSIIAKGSSKYAAEVTSCKIIENDQSDMCLTSIRTDNSKVEMVIDFKGKTAQLEQQWQKIEPNSLIFLLHIDESGIKQFVASRLLKSSAPNNRQRKYILLTSKKVSDTKKMSKMNFVFKGNDQIDSIMKRLFEIQSMRQSNQKTWLTDYILNIGGEPKSFGGDSSITLKIADKLYEIDSESSNKVKRTKTENGHSLNGGAMHSASYTDIKSNISKISKEDAEEIVIPSLLKSLTVLDGSNFSRKEELLASVCLSLVQSFPKENILLVTKTNCSRNRVIKKLQDKGLEKLVYNPSTPNSKTNLNQIEDIVTHLKMEDFYASDVRSIQFLFETKIKPLWRQFLETFKESPTNETIATTYPFKSFDLKSIESKDPKENIHRLLIHYQSIVDTFRYTEVSRTETPQIPIYTISECQAIKTLKFDTLILQNCESLGELDLINVITRNEIGNQNRVILSGDSSLDNTQLMSKFISQIGTNNVLNLPDDNNEVNEEMRRLFHGSDLQVADRYLFGNPGFLNATEFINVEGDGEIEVQPGQLQNLEEAEYAVALFMYMRLLGYPTSKISIVTGYKAQKLLIEEILGQRCRNEQIFGRLPKVVDISDDFIEINDYTISSLVNTTEIGIWNNERNLRKMISNSVKGLYIVGSAALFGAASKKNLYNYKIFKSLILDLKEYSTPDWKQLFKLHLVGHEMYHDQGKIERNPDGEITKRPQLPSGYDMENLQHFGSYVSQMTETKLKNMGKNM